MIINSQTLRNKNVMVLLRKFVLQCLKINAKVSARHVPGVRNLIPDQLSRSHSPQVVATHFGLDPHPVAIPRDLLPGNFVVG